MSQVVVTGGDEPTVIEVGFAPLSLPLAAFAVVAEIAHPNVPTSVPIGEVPHGELGGTWIDPIVQSVHGPEGKSHAQLLTEAASNVDVDVAAHEAALNPHTQYASDVDLAAHAAALDPHPGYVDDATLAAHLAAGDPHAVYATGDDLIAHEQDAVGVHGIVDTALLETQAGAATKVADHAAAANPHPTYATDADITAHANAVDPHAGYATDADLIGHAAAADPHTGYVQEAELTAHAADPTGVHGITDTGQLETQTGAQARVDTHAAAGNPHPAYATDADVAAHVNAADPHPTIPTVGAHEAALDPHGGYQKESERGADDGYAPLDADGLLPTEHLPAGLATDSDITDAITAHGAEADPHGGYERESQKGVAGGYASLDGAGTVPDAQIPATIARDSELPDLGAHVSAADPHTGYQRETERGVADGYASLDVNARVPDAQLGTGVVDGTKFLRGNRQWTAVDESGLANNAVSNAKLRDSGAASVIGRSAATSGDPADIAATADGQVLRRSGGLLGFAALDEPMIPPEIARDTEVTTAVNNAVVAHEGQANPHTGYATDTDLADHAAAADPHAGYVTDAALASHVGEADPHTVYVRESLVDAKGDLLAGTGVDALARLPAGSDGRFLRAASGQATGLEWHDHVGEANPHTGYATDTDLSDHAAAVDPHTGYVREAAVDAKGDMFVATAADVVTRLPVGADGQVLKANSLATEGVEWAAESGGGGSGIPATIADAKGDLIAGTAADVVARLPVGTDGMFLRAQGSQSTGLQWYDHEGAADPHSVYATDAAVTAAVSAHDLVSKHWDAAGLTAARDVWVSATGNDLTAIVGRRDKPFASFSAMRTAMGTSSPVSIHCEGSTNGASPTQQWDLGSDNVMLYTGDRLYGYGGDADRERAMTFIKANRDGPVVQFNGRYCYVDGICVTNPHNRGIGFGNSDDVGGGMQGIFAGRIFAYRCGLAGFRGVGFNVDSSVVEYGDFSNNDGFGLLMETNSSGGGSKTPNLFEFRTLITNQNCKNSAGVVTDFGARSGAEAYDNLNAEVLLWNMEPAPASGGCVLKIGMHKAHGGTTKVRDLGWRQLDLEGYYYEANQGMEDNQAAVVVRKGTGTGGSTRTHYAFGFHYGFGRMHNIQMKTPANWTVGQPIVFDIDETCFVEIERGEIQGGNFDADNPVTRIRTNVYNWQVDYGLVTTGQDRGADLVASEATLCLVDAAAQVRGTFTYEDWS